MTKSSAADILVPANDGVEKRRGSRLMVDVPITVMGMDTLGEPFKESTTTISVSCYGCKYRSRRYAPKGSVVTLEIRQQQLPKESRIVHARVVWVQRPRHHRETFQIGLELETQGNVWGIDSPPADRFPPPEEFSPPAAALSVAEIRSPEIDAIPQPPAVPTASPEPAPANDWETLDIPHPAKPASDAPEAIRAPDDVARDLVNETVRITSDAIIAEEIALLRKHFTGRLESALLETLKSFSELSVEIVNETREACRASAKQIEADLQQIAREAAAQHDQSAGTSTRKTPHSKRRNRKMPDGA